MKHKDNDLAGTPGRPGDAGTALGLGGGPDASWGAGPDAFWGAGLGGGPGVVGGADLGGGDAGRLLALGEAAALAPNTRRAYGTGWGSWCLWAAGRGVAVFPACPGDLKRWLGALAAEGKRPSTLRAYLAAVEYWHRHHLGPNPARDPGVRGLLSGLSRLAAARGEAPRQAFGLRWVHVLRIADAAYRPRRSRPGGRKETAEQARRRGDLDVALACLAHDALLRCAELLALRWSDIDLPDEGGLGTVQIRRSKSDQHAKGAAASISEYTCEALARLRPADYDPSDPVFDISPNTVTRRLKAASQAAGIDPEGVSSHSPRVGMAQDLAASGTDMAGLMLAGRWTTTTTPARYTRNLAAHHTPAAQYLKTQHNPPAPRPQHSPQTTDTAPPRPLRGPPAATPAPPRAQTPRPDTHRPRPPGAHRPYRRRPAGLERIASRRRMVIPAASATSKRLWPALRAASMSLARWARAPSRRDCNCATALEFASNSLS